METSKYSGSVITSCTGPLTPLISPQIIFTLTPSATITSGICSCVMPLIIARSGDVENAPERTLPAFESAISRGADGPRT